MIRRTMIGLAATTAAMLGLAACGNSTPSSKGTTPPSSKTSSAHVVLTAENNTGVTFTDNFNPFDASSVDTEMSFRSVIYEPLLQFNYLQAGVVHDWLATGYSWSNGGKKLTFTIRPGVKWSDGKPLTANDVAFTFNLIRSNPAANYAGDPTMSAPAVAKGNTVVLTFAAAAYSDLPEIGGSTYIVPQHIWQSIKQPATATISSPVGSGPYVLHSYTSQLIELTRNPTYWDGTPPVYQLNIPAYSSNSSAATALSSGQLQWAGNDIANVQSVFIAKDPSHNFTYFAPGNTVALIFNVAKGGPLADPKVREAISVGIDRQALATKGESGYEKPATSTSGLILPSQSSFLTSSDTNNLKTTADPSMVASILSSDGYKKVGGFWQKNGQEISFSVEDPTSYSDYYADDQLISSELKSEGINCTVDGVAASQWYTDLADGNFQTAIHWGAGGASPFVQFDNWMDYTLSAPIGQTATADYGRFHNSAAQSALAAAATTNPSDTSAFSSAMQKLSSIMTTQVPVAPLLYGADWDEYSTTSVTGFPSASNPYMDPSPSDPELPYILMHLKVTS